MSDFDHGCPDCGGKDGNHYNDCIYDGTSGGNSSLGGDALGKLIFAGFCVVGVVIGCLCPPVGAGIIVIGAKITGV